MKIDIETSKMMGFADFFTCINIPDYAQAFKNDPNFGEEKWEEMEKAFEMLKPLRQFSGDFQTGELLTSLAFKAATGKLDSNDIDALCDEIEKGLPVPFTEEQRAAMHTLYDGYSGFFDANMEQMSKQVEGMQEKANNTFPKTLEDAADFIGYEIPEDYKTGCVVIPSPKGAPPHGRSVENKDGSRTQFATISADNPDIDDTLITIFHEDVHKLIWDSGTWKKAETELSTNKQVGQLTSDANLWNEAIAILFQNKYCDQNGLDRRIYGKDLASQAYDAEANRLEDYLDNGGKLLDDNGHFSSEITSKQVDHNKHCARYELCHTLQKLNANPLMQKLYEEQNS